MLAGTDGNTRKTLAESLTECTRTLRADSPE
jgi:hypothetical protein